MISWIVSNWATILVLAVVAALVFLALRSVYKNKGTCSCGSCKGGCSGCYKCGPEEISHRD